METSDVRRDVSEKCFGTSRATILTARGHGCCALVRRRVHKRDSDRDRRREKNKRTNLEKGRVGKSSRKERSGSRWEGIATRVTMSEGHQPNRIGSVGTRDHDPHAVCKDWRLPDSVGRTFWLCSLVVLSPSSGSLLYRLTGETCFYLIVYLIWEAA
ncbi:hypothetical protein LY78DRAFT_88447 [Colletotrichum sublineola]|nr:hypothetical protein LY78DRAFT_88447 [Colletotrichum sublineola]